jgi:hypothetical protein
MDISSPQLKDSIRSIYLASRIEPWDWRHTVVQGLRDDIWNWKDGSPFPVMNKALFGVYDYVGPYWPNLNLKHDWDYEGIPDRYLPSGVRDKLTEERYSDLCKEAIGRADLVAGYFSEYPNKDMNWDWFVASQLLYAISLGKKILTINHNRFDYDYSEAVLVGNYKYRNKAPRVSLGYQLGLNNKEICKDAGVGFVYFIEAVEDRYIKIGWAYNPSQRLREFQTASPKEYKLLGTIPGSRTLEQKLHKDFEQYHAKGEWFFGVKPLWDFIRLHVPHPLEGKKE